MKVEPSNMSFLQSAPVVPLENGSSPNDDDDGAAVASGFDTKDTTSISIEEEHRRVLSLQTYHLMDHAFQDQSYVRFTAIAARFLRAQVARIVLVDLDRCFVVASSISNDQAPQEMPRRKTLYEVNAIEQSHEKVFCVPDLCNYSGVSSSAGSRNKSPSSSSHTPKHPQTAKPPQLWDPTTEAWLSHEGPEGNHHHNRIRFYAGAPLRNDDGHVLGVLAVMDSNPRAGALSAVEQQVLQDLASSCLDLMDEKRRQLFDGVNAQPFHPGLLRSARFVADQMTQLHSDRELCSVCGHHQASAMESAVMSARFLVESLKPPSSSSLLGSSSEGSFPPSVPLSSSGNTILAFNSS